MGRGGLFLLYEEKMTIGKVEGEAIADK